MPLAETNEWATGPPIRKRPHKNLSLEDTGKETIPPAVMLRQGGRFGGILFPGD